MITDGILNINKPEGWTSQDVCAKLRGRLHIKKIGHAGTLDPMAKGVLPICIGKATRIIEYYDKDFKSYHAAMKLGITTDTLDITGQILTRKNVSIVDYAENNVFKTDDFVFSKTQIQNAFSNYAGEVEQIPPKYSAIKINGHRAYDLAREGKDFEIKSRKIFIKSNKLVSVDVDNLIVEFDVLCSKGTYIRTICDDIGKTLRCGATMTALTRTASGFFKIDDAIDLDKVLKMSDDELEKYIIPADTTLIELGTIKLNENRKIAFGNGHSSSERTYKITFPSKFDNFYKVYSNEFLGIGEIVNNELIPIKVFK